MLYCLRQTAKLLEKEANENHNDHYFYDELIRYAALLFLYVIFLFL